MKNVKNQNNENNYTCSLHLCPSVKTKPKKQFSSLCDFPERGFQFDSSMFIACKFC